MTHGCIKFMIEEIPIMMESDNRLSSSDEIDDKELVQQYIHESGVVLDTNELIGSCGDGIKMEDIDSLGEGGCDDVKVETMNHPLQGLKSEQDDTESLSEVKDESDVTAHFESEYKSSGTSQIYKCDHCAYETHQQSYLKEHISNKHFEEKNHQCIVCSYSSSTKIDLDRHMILKHNRRKTKEYIKKCSHCEYSTGNWSNLRKHIRNIHRKEVHFEESKKTIKCPHCDYSTAQLNFLRKHIRSVHLKEKNHSCSICSYSSFSKADMDRHILLKHDEEGRKTNMKQCTHCEFRTVQSSYLKKHIYRRHGPGSEKVYKCKYCEFAAVFLSALNRHTKNIHYREWKESLKQETTQ